MIPHQRMGILEYMPKVSIIIPVYNQGKYIKEAVTSALDQTWEDKEVIVIDDGSTDNSVLKAYAAAGETPTNHLNFTVIQKENGGPASALNFGIMHSMGDFIKWLSADDVLYPDAIQTMMEQIDGNYKNRIYYTNYHIIDENSNITSQFKEPERNNLTRFEKGRELLRYYYGNGSSSLIHRSIFERCGLFDESLKHSEDYEYWLRCTLMYGVELWLLPIYSLKYRYHNEQLTKRVGGSLDDFIKRKVLMSLPVEERQTYGFC